MLSPSASIRKDSQQAATPTTASTRRKRKRLAETLSSLVQNGADSPAVHKRRSSISDAGHLSVSGSFLDCTASPDKQMLDGNNNNHYFLLCIIKYFNWSNF